LFGVYGTLGPSAQIQTKKRVVHKSIQSEFIYTNPPYILYVHEFILGLDIDTRFSYTNRIHTFSKPFFKFKRNLIKIFLQFSIYQPTTWVLFSCFRVSIINPKIPLKYQKRTLPIPNRVQIPHITIIPFRTQISIVEASLLFLDGIWRSIR